MPRETHHARGRVALPGKSAEELLTSSVLPRPVWLADL